MYMAAPQIIGVMTPVEEIRVLGSKYRIEAFAEPMFTASIVAYGVFVEAGSTSVPSLMNFASIWGVRLTLARMARSRDGIARRVARHVHRALFPGAIFLVELWGGNWIYKLRIKKINYEIRFRHDYPASRTNSLQMGYPPKRGAYCPCGWRIWTFVPLPPLSKPCNGAWRTGFSAIPKCRRLLRCRRAVVREPSPLAGGSPVDRLYERRRSGVVGDHQSPDGSGRQGDRPAPAYNCSTRRSATTDAKCRPIASFTGTTAIRSISTISKLKPRRSEGENCCCCNPHNPGRTGLDAGRAAAYRRHLPAARGIRGCGRNPCELTYEGHDYTPFASLSNAS